MKEKTKEMIGKNLRTKRKEHGFTQEKLAEKAGVNVRSIQRIEQGTEQPDLDMLSKIGAALQIDWQELIYGSEPVDYIEHERRVQLIIEHCNVLIFGGVGLVAVIALAMLFIKRKKAAKTGE